MKPITWKLNSRFMLLKFDISKFRRISLLRSLRPRIGIIVSVMVFAMLACQAVAPKTTQAPENPPAPSQAAVAQPTEEKLTEQVIETSPIRTQSASSTIEKPAETASPLLPTLPAPQPGPEQLDLS